MSQSDQNDFTAKKGKYRCPLDGMTFDSKADLDRHYKRVHIAESGLV